MQYLFAFLVGGVLCVIAQLLIDKTSLTPARILVTYVVSGVVLTRFAGAGATVPLTGFGYSLAKGVEEGVNESGFLGIFSGGLSSCAAGVGAAVFFSFIAALCRRKLRFKS